MRHLLTFRKLGITYYVLLLASLFYVIQFMIIRDKGYLDIDYPVGILRPTLHRVTLHNQIVLTRKRFPDVNVDKFAYCNSTECRIWDHFDAPYPLTGEEKVHLTNSNQIFNFSGIINFNPSENFSTNSCMRWKCKTMQRKGFHCQQRKKYNFFHCWNRRLQCNFKIRNVEYND